MRVRLRAWRELVQRWMLEDMRRLVATEGKFVYPLVQGLTPDQERFFKSIDFTKEAVVCYVMKPEAAPKEKARGRYIPSHPDPMKRKRRRGT